MMIRNAPGCLLVLAMLAAGKGATAGIPLPASSWEQQLRSDASLNAVWANDGGRIWAVGDRGTIVVSADGGRSWHAQESHTTARLLDVAFIDDKRGWIVGGWLEPDTRISRGLLLKTEDGGTHWSSVPVDLPLLRSIHPTNHLQAWVAGDWSAAHTTSLFETVDGGQHWQPMGATDLGPILAAANDPSHPVVLRGGLAMMRSMQTMRHVPVTADSSITSIAAQNGMVAFVGANRVAIQTPGLPLQVESPDTQRAGYELLCAHFDRGRLWVAGRSGGRLWWRRRGRWESVDTAMTGSVNDICAAGDGMMVAVGSFGQIQVSDDAGTHWTITRNPQACAAAIVFASDASRLPHATVAQLSGSENLRVVTVLLATEPTSDPCVPDTSTTAQHVGLALGANECVAIRTADEARRRASIRLLVESYRPAMMLIGTAIANEEANRIARIASGIAPSLPVLQQTTAGRGSVLVHNQRALPGWGTTVAFHVGEADALLAAPPRPRAETWQLRNRTPGTPEPRDLVPRWLRIASSAKRESRPGHQRYLGLVQARSRYPEIISQLVQAAMADPSADGFGKKLASLIAKLPDEHADEVLRATIRETAEQQFPQLWRQCLKVAIDEAGERGLGRHAFVQYRAIERSSEWMHSEDQPIQIARARYEPPLDTTAPRSPFVHQERLQERAERLETILPQSTPSVPTLAAGAIDLLFGAQPIHLLLQESPAKSELDRWQQSRAAGPWREVFFPETIPAERQLAVRFAETRPKLDGRLDDALWADRQLDSSESPTMRLCYDSEFLYIAATWRGNAVKQTKQRTRDAALDDEQRLVIWLDVDEDMLTSYQLEIDASGQTRESCDGFHDWQPRWFVATDASDGRVVMEAAVRRESLVGLPPAPGDRWRVRCRVLQPGQSIPFGPSSDPSSWAIATFQ